MTARGRTLWDLTAARLPAHAAQVRRATEGSAPTALDAAYEAMSDANFSQAVLETTSGLATTSVTGSGWCDWGTPERVFASLRGTPHLARLLERLTGPQRSPPRSSRAKSVAGSTPLWELS